MMDLRFALSSLPLSLSLWARCWQLTSSQLSTRILLTAEQVHPQRTGERLLSPFLFSLVLLIYSIVHRDLHVYLL